MQSLNRSPQTLTRNRYPVKVLQFGNGDFLRGFADWMIQVANEKVGFNAGISVVSGPAGPDNPQAYTVILKGIREEEFISQQYQIDVVSRVIDADEDFESFLHEAINADLQFIISNVREGQSFSEKDLSVSTVAMTFPGKLTQLLFNRFNCKLDSSILILPTEPIEYNGTYLKHQVQRYCTHWALPSDFTVWLNRHITFCNTLVDRLISGRHGTKNQMSLEQVLRNEIVVEGEWFHLWVIEGPRWIEEMLPLRKAGLNVIYTDNLAPYYLMQLRICTAVQVILRCASNLAGLKTIRDTIEHPVIGRYIKRLIFDDILQAMPGDIRSLERYAEEVIDRFRNPLFNDQLRSLDGNLTSDFNSAVLPTIVAQIEKNGAVSNRLSFAMAMLIFSFNGKREIVSGESDELMKELWSKGGQTANDMLEKSRRVFASLWNTSFKNVPLIAEQVGQQLYSLAQSGIIESLKRS